MMMNGSFMEIQIGNINIGSIQLHTRFRPPDGTLELIHVPTLSTLRKMTFDRNINVWVIISVKKREGRILKALSLNL